MTAADDDETYQGDVWYVTPADGPQQAFKTPMKAMIALDTLNVAGKIECYSRLTRHLNVTMTRDSAGQWSVPPPS